MRGAAEASASGLPSTISEIHHQDFPPFQCVILNETACFCLKIIETASGKEVKATTTTIK